MQGIRWMLVLVVVVLGLGMGSARGEIVHIRIEGEVSSLRRGGPELSELFAIGDPVSGVYTYEASSGPANTRSGSSSHWFRSQPYGIKLTVGDFTIESNPDDLEFLIEILNDKTRMDAYGVTSYNNLPLSTGLSVDMISWQLIDYSEAALSGTSLLGTAPILADWPDHWGLNIFFGYKGGLLLETRIESATIIPEPATLLLLGAGAIGYLWTNRQ